MRRRCSRNTRLLSWLGGGVLLLNLAIGYALLSLHGLVHAPPLLLTRLVASAQDTATHEDPAEVAEEGRDEWDVAEDLLAAHERGMEEGHPAVGGGGGLDETIEGHVDVTLVTQVSLGLGLRSGLGLGLGSGLGTR